MKKFLLFYFIVLAFSCSNDDDPAIRSFNLKTSITPEEGGSVSPASGNFDSGDIVNLSAVPKSGFVFKQWSGDVSGTENPISLTMTSDKNINAVFEAEESEIAGEITGKWIIDNSNTAQAAEAPGRQESLEECYLFSLVFNSDATFIISHRGGEITGTYTFTGPNTISLGTAGNLYISDITADTITFEIELSGICRWEGQAFLDTNFEEGSCVSFLNCHSGTTWKVQSNNSAEFIRFTNNLSGLWFESFGYNLEGNCRSFLLTNQNSEEPILLTRNNPSELNFLQQKSTGDMMTSFKFDNSGNLVGSFQTSEETITKNFEPSDSEELNNYSNFPDCSEKTYVPDDNFEKELINRGYDDVLDDYVLTANIVAVTKLYFHTNDFRNNLDMTGLEDFSALKELEIWSYSFNGIDLSKNINLERLVLGSGDLSSLDITNNKKLRSIYIEFAVFSTIDISQNTELRFLELSQTAINSIDISKNTKLEMLTIEGGNLTSVTSGTNVNLWHLDLDNQSLDSFDATRFPNMEELILQDNEMKFLDISGLTKIKLLQIDGNELETLDISHLANLEGLSVSNNPLLTCIQVSQEQLDRIAAPGDTANFWGNDSSAEFSLDCSN